MEAQVPRSAVCLKEFLQNLKKTHTHTCMHTHTLTQVFNQNQSEATIERKQEAQMSKMTVRQAEG